MEAAPQSAEFLPYAEQIASKSVGTGLAPAVLIPLILDVLPRILFCLHDRGLAPVTALRDTSHEAVSDSHREVRLARRYWNRSRRSTACPNLDWDQALVLAAHTITAGRQLDANQLQSLTDLAMAMPKEALS